MKQDRSSALFRSSNQVFWVKDTNQILILDIQGTKTWVLQGEEAAIWSSLILAYPYRKIVQLLSTTMDWTNAEAELQLQSVIQKWHNMGLLIKEER